MSQTSSHSLRNNNNRGGARENSGRLNEEEKQQRQQEIARAGAAAKQANYRQRQIQLEEWKSLGNPMGRSSTYEENRLLLCLLLGFMITYDMNQTQAVEILSTLCKRSEHTLRDLYNHWKQTKNILQHDGIILYIYLLYIYFFYYLFFCLTIDILFFFLYIINYLSEC
jgi:hypothetical protein